MTSGECYEGYWCDGSDSWPKNEAKGCEVGNYCVAGTDAQAACPEGEY